MKKLAILGIAAMLCGSIHAQQEANLAAAQVSTTEAFDYNRCSLSIITLGSGSSLQSWAKSADFGGKFDMNKIRTTSISADNNADNILEVLKREYVGKQVLNYWVGYDGRMFNPTILQQRSSYNATDADVLRDNTAQVQRLGTANASRDLMANSYIMVVNATTPEKKGKSDYYSTTVDAHVFRVDLNNDVIAQTWDNWLEEDATAEMKSQYDAIDVEIENVVSVMGKSGIGKTPEDALVDAFDKALTKLEKKIDKWQVVTSIYKKHPLSAKIGKKENLKNSDRYRAFKLVEDKDGNLTAKKVGFVRATNIVDNRQVATGESECSKFYQISGRTLREGMYLKQKNDAKMSLSASGILGGYSPFSIDIDYLAHTSRALGTMQYFGLSVGAYAGEASYGDNALWIPFALNYSLGIHPVRVLEITPNIGIGADYYVMPDSDNSESKMLKQFAYFAHAGVKFGLQIWYPVQLFVRADYSVSISEGELYIPAATERFGKLSFGAGIKINF